MDFSSTSDSILWEALQRGQEKAFETIYDRYFERLYEYGMRLCGDQNLVKDSIQALFIKLWTNRASLSTTVNIRPYLLVALRGTIYNEQRPRRSGVVVALDQAPEDFLAHFSSETAYIKQEQANEQQQKLLQALNQLSGRQKEIIYLRYFEELDYDTISGMMNISVKGAYKLSARALQSLREILQVSTGILLVWMTELRNYQSLNA